MLKRIVGRFDSDGHNAHSKKVFVAAFGKHPGWDDHIDDIGLNTDILVSVKRILYIQGIAPNIDCGRWEQLQDDQRLAEFKHLFFWRLNGNFVIGRMWSSSDGKGRTSYPMIVCVQCPKLSLHWIFENIAPALQRIQGICTATTSPADVQTALENAQREFRQLVRQDKSSARSRVKLPHLLATLSRFPEMGIDHQGLLRILYHMQREVTRYKPDNSKRKAVRPTLLRVPVSQPEMMQRALLWLAFLLKKFHGDIPVLAIIPLQESWLDIIIGEPTDSHLSCLRSSLNTIPLTSSIPYNMGPEFIEQTAKLINQPPQ